MTCRLSLWSWKKHGDQITSSLQKQLQQFVKRFEFDIAACEIQRLSQNLDERMLSSLNFARTALAETVCERMLQLEKRFDNIMLASEAEPEIST